MRQKRLRKIVKGESLELLVPARYNFDNNYETCQEFQAFFPSTKPTHQSANDEITSPRQ